VVLEGNGDSLTPGNKIWFLCTSSVNVSQFRNLSELVPVKLRTVVLYEVM
jgi:hypothetical protein